MRDIQNAGSDILDAVSKAVASGNYANLSDSIRNSVSSITSSAKTNQGSNPQVRPGAYVFNEHLKGTTAQWKRPDSLRTYSRGTRPSAAGQTAVQAGGAKQLPATPYFSQGLQRFSPYTGGVQMALGGIGALAAGGGAALLLIPGLIATGGMAAAFLAMAGVCAAGAVAGGVVAKKGFDKQRLFTRYRQYGHVLGDAEYMKIDDLAHFAGVSRKQLLKDIDTCQKSGYLTDTYLDAQETTLIVSRKAYDQYTAAESSRLQREKEKLALKDSLAESGYGAQVEQILSEGEDYLKTVRELNVRIPDEEMTKKISRIEDLMHRTFEEVKKQPKAASSLRKYMSYYLPTTVKLLNAYADLDAKPEIGDNITKTKQEISASLDMVGDAFEKLFDSLFEEMSWDISSDISVMKTMMAQDGLTEDTITARTTGAS